MMKQRAQNKMGLCRFWRMVDAGVLTIWFVTQTFQPVVRALPDPSILDTAFSLEGAATLVDFYLPEKSLMTPEMAMADPDQKLIVYIQDAHGNISAQQKIAQVLDRMVRQNKIQEPWIALEGTRVGEIDHHYLSSLREKISRKLITDYLLYRGELSGADYYTAHFQPGTRFFGIDNEGDAERNREYYRQYAEKSRKVELVLGKLLKADQFLRMRVYTDGLKRLDQVLAAIETQDYKIFENLKTLDELARQSGVSQDDLPMLNLMRQVKETERKFLASTSEKEKQQLAAEQGEDFSDDQIIFERWLQDPAFLENYPHLNRKMQLFESSRKIRGEVLFRELYALADRLWGKMLDFPEARDVHAMGQTLHFYKKLFDFSLVPHDYDAYLKNPKFYSLKTLKYKMNDYAFLLLPSGLLPSKSEIRLLARASTEPLKFYESARSRDASLAENLIALAQTNPSSKTFVIAGGFHREGLSERLRAKGLAYVVLTPEVDSMEGHENYWKRMDQHQILLENLLGLNSGPWTVKRPDNGRVAADAATVMLENINLSSPRRLQILAAFAMIASGQDPEAVRSQLGLPYPMRVLEPGWVMVEGLPLVFYSGRQKPSGLPSELVSYRVLEAAQMPGGYAAIYADPEWVRAIRERSEARDADSISFGSLLNLSQADDPDLNIRNFLSELAGSITRRLPYLDRERLQYYLQTAYNQMREQHGESFRDRLYTRLKERPLRVGIGRFERVMSLSDQETTRDLYLDERTVQWVSFKDGEIKPTLDYLEVAELLIATGVRHFLLDSGVVEAAGIPLDRDIGFLNSMMPEAARNPTVLAQLQAQAMDIQAFIMAALVGATTRRGEIAMEDGEFFGGIIAHLYQQPLAALGQVVGTVNIPAGATPDSEVPAVASRGNVQVSSGSILQNRNIPPHAGSISYDAAFRSHFGHPTKRPPVAPKVGPGRMLLGKYTIEEDAFVSGERYQLKERLGKGASGEGWLVKDMSLPRTLAMKVVWRRSAVDAERFAVEAERAAREVLTMIDLAGVPNVPDFIDQEGLLEGGRQRIAAGVQSGQAEGWILMSMAQGNDLDLAVTGLKQDDYFLDPRHAVAIMQQTAATLAAAHRKGVVHRDIKPANIRLVFHDNGTVDLMILDWGLARNSRQPDDFLSGSARTRYSSFIPRAAVTQAGDVLGTPAYMSPEQAKNPVQADDQSDIFSLGATFYYMMTGASPAESLPGPPADSLLEVLRRNERGLYPHPGQINPDLRGTPLEYIILKMLAPRNHAEWNIPGAAKRVDSRGQPVYRYASDAELLADIEALARDELLPSAVHANLKGNYRIETWEDYENLISRRRFVKKVLVSAAIVLAVVSVVGLPVVVLNARRIYELFFTPAPPVEPNIPGSSPPVESEKVDVVEGQVTWNGRGVGSDARRDVTVITKTGAPREIDLGFYWKRGGNQQIFSAEGLGRQEFYQLKFRVESKPDAKEQPVPLLAGSAILSLPAVLVSEAKPFTMTARAWVPEQPQQAWIGLHDTEERSVAVEIGPSIRVLKNLRTNYLSGEGTSIDEFFNDTTRPENMLTPPKGLNFPQEKLISVEISKAKETLDAVVRIFDDIQDPEHRNPLQEIKLTLHQGIYTPWLHLSAGPLISVPEVEGDIVIGSVKQLEAEIERPEARVLLEETPTSTAIATLERTVQPVVLPLAAKSIALARSRLPEQTRLKTDRRVPVVLLRWNKAWQENWEQIFNAQSYALGPTDHHLVFLMTREDRKALEAQLPKNRQIYKVTFLEANYDDMMQDQTYSENMLERLAGTIGVIREEMLTVAMAEAFPEQAAVAGSPEQEFAQRGFVRLRYHEADFLTDRTYRGRYFLLSEELARQINLFNQLELNSGDGSYAVPSGSGLEAWLDDQLQQQQAHFMALRSA